MHKIVPLRAFQGSKNTAISERYAYICIALEREHLCRAVGTGCCYVGLRWQLLGYLGKGRQTARFRRGRCERVRVDQRLGLPPAYDQRGVDLTLIRERLRMTPRERIECVDETNQLLEMHSRAPRIN